MKHKLEIASVRANEHTLLLIILYIVFAQINSMKPSREWSCVYIAALLIIIPLSALITFLFVTPSASDLPRQIQSPVMRHIIGEQNDICFDYVEVAHPSLLPVTKRYFLTDHAMDRALYVHEPLEQPYTEPELRAIIARMKENSGT